MKHLINFIIALLVVTVSACTPDNEVAFSDNLVLKHKGANMPIWVRGNLERDKILLFLHGGPGECAMCLRNFFTDIEKEIAVAYWDQRIAGSSSGNADPATLTYPQFAEDLKMAVQLLKYKYPTADIYLLGHSFGVEMAWQFLTTDDNQNLVKAAIILDGTYATYPWLVQVREWALREARAQQDEEAENFWLAHPVTRENMHSVNWGDWYSRMFRLGANPVWPTDDKNYVYSLWFKMPHSKFSSISNIGHYDDYYAKEIFTFDCSDLLKNVRIPIGLFWGVKDGIIPIEVGYQTEELLTNAPTTFVRFEESWHSALSTETETFSEEVLKFVSEN